MLLAYAALLANDKPMSLGLAMAYMNNILEFPSEQFDQIRTNKAQVKANFDILYSPTYTVSNFSAAYVYKDVLESMPPFPRSQTAIQTKTHLRA